MIDKNKIIFKTDKGLLKSIYIKCKWFEKEINKENIKEIMRITPSIYSYSEKSYIVIVDTNIEFKIYFSESEVEYIETNELYTEIKNLKEKINEIEKRIK